MRLIVTMTEEMMSNMEPFLKKCVNFKHIDFNGNSLLPEEKFVDLFGWTFSFVDHIIQFIATQNCFQFLLFIRDFHSTYRAYMRFEEFFSVYKHDRLYQKYKKNMMIFFGIDLEHIEQACEKENENTLTDRNIHYSTYLQSSTF